MKNFQPSFQKIWLCASVAIFILLSGGIVLQWYMLQKVTDDLQELRATDTLTWKRFDALFSQNIKFTNLLQEQIRDAQKNYGLQQETMFNLQDQINALGKNQKSLESSQKNYVENLRSSADAQTRRFSALFQKTQFILGILVQQLEPADAAAKTPHPFSYYESPEWKNQRDEYVSRSRELWGGIKISIDGAGGVDTMNDSGAGDSFLDSVFIKNIEIYNVSNKLPNKITVTAPGLTNLENKSLKIMADKDIDSVVLDGCLKWKAPVKTTDVATWTASDSSGEKRAVSVSSGVPVAVQHSCDNRYFFTEDMLLLPILSRAMNSLSLQGMSSQASGLTAESFGGIGLAFSDSPSGLFAAYTLSGTPAERAGLKMGDEIIEVDGRSISGMSRESATALIRGQPGTTVVLTYRPSESPDTTRKVTLTREMIQNSIPIQKPQ